MDWSKLQILILAAGKSSRMGKPKQLLSVDDKKLLEVIMEKALKLHSGGVHCIIGAHADLIKSQIKQEQVNFIYNPQWSEGLSRSIQFGIEHIQTQQPDTEFILLLLGDQPGVSVTYIKYMIKAAQQRSGFIIASDYGGFKGVPVLFAKAQFDLFKNLNGDSGAKELLNKDQNKVYAIHAEVNLQDVDTPADYEHFLNQIRND